jgi:hypothetical protein
MTMAIKKPKDTVFFHTLDAQGEIEWQGIVLRELPLGHLEIELFSWLSGEPTERRIVNGAERKWVFYTSEAKWLAHGDKSMSI